MRVRYGVSFVNITSDTHFTSVIVVTYEESYYVGPRYNGTWLYRSLGDSASLSALSGDMETLKFFVCFNFHSSSKLTCLEWSLQMKYFQTWWHWRNRYGPCHWTLRWAPGPLGIAPPHTSHCKHNILTATHRISMVYHKTAVIPLLTHWSYCSPVLSKHKISMTSHSISIAYCKIAVTPLLMHWSYCSLVLSHQYTLWWTKNITGIFIAREDNSSMFMQIH